MVGVWMLIMEGVGHGLYYIFNNNRGGCWIIEDVELWSTCVYYNAFIRCILYV